MKLKRLNREFIVPSKLSHQNIDREVRRVINDDQDRERLGKLLLGSGHSSRTVDDAPVTNRGTGRWDLITSSSTGFGRLATIVIRLTRRSPLISGFGATPFPAPSPPPPSLLHALTIRSTRTLPAGCGLHRFHSSLGSFRTPDEEAPRLHRGQSLTPADTAGSPVPSLVALEAASSFPASRRTVRRRKTVEAPSPKVDWDRPTRTSQLLQTLLAGAAALIPLPAASIGAVRDRDHPGERLQRRRSLLYRRKHRNSTFGKKGVAIRGTTRRRGRASVVPSLDLGTTTLGLGRGRGRRLGGGGSLRMRGWEGGRRTLGRFRRWA